MKTCGDIMTINPRYCITTDTIARVAQMMKTEDVGLIPVVENRNSMKVVGVITDRDLVMRVLADDANEQNPRVETVMTRHPVTCREQDNLDKALTAMADYQVRRIPIVNDRDQLVGIIAQADVATRGEQPEKTAEVVEEISQP